MMAHLKNFSASEGGNLNKNFPKIQMPGGCPGCGCLSFDLTDTPSLGTIIEISRLATEAGVSD